MEPSGEQQWSELILRCLDGTASHEEQVAFVKRLHGDPQALAHYVRLADVSAGLYWSKATAHVMPQVLVDRAAPSEEQDEIVPAGRLRYWGHTAYWVVAQPMSLSVIVAGLFVTTVLLSLALLRVELVPPGVNGHVAAVDEPRQVAHVTRMHNTVWSDESRGMIGEAGALQADQTLSLRSGLAEIRCLSGTVVLVEGPATFTPRGSNSLELKSGNLTANVPQSAVGFVVSTPQASIIDLGTEFGVSVPGEGAAEVAVFKGAVQINRTSAPGEVLAAGEAVRVGEDRVERIETPRFVQEFPRRYAISVNFFDKIHSHNRLPANSIVAGVATSCWNQFGVDSDSGEPGVLDRLVDDRGHTTAAQIEVDAQAGWEVGLGLNATAARTLENGYWDTQRDGGRITISGLPEELTTQGYEVVVYLHGTNEMGDDTAGEFGARIAAEERWLRWIKNAPNGIMSPSPARSESEAEESLRDDNVLVFDNDGRLYNTPDVVIDVFDDPDANGDGWGRAAVSAIQLRQRAQ